MWPRRNADKTSPATAKTRKVCMAVTADEKSLIERAARQRGVSVSDHLRTHMKKGVIDVQSNEQSSDAG